MSLGINTLIRNNFQLITMPNIFIDARSMQPPEPLERALTALDVIGHDGTLTIVLNQQPYPLFQILKNSGFQWEEVPNDDGFRFDIRKSLP
jgi:uncharacterized protein (DUF2249 family)